MLIERYRYFYVPIKTFARLSGVDEYKIKSSISNGIIHHSYVLKIKVEDCSFKYRIFIRQDKARAYGEFMYDYMTATEMADKLRKRYGLNVYGNHLEGMLLQGYIPVEWCVFVYPNGDSRTVYIQADKISTIADVYEVFITEEEKRERKGIKEGQRTIEPPQPENAVLFKPNPECEGFMLTPEQVELLKLFRKYRENKEPLF